MLKPNKEYLDVRRYGKRLLSGSSLEPPQDILREAQKIQDEGMVVGCCFLLGMIIFVVSAIK